MNSLIAAERGGSGPTAAVLARAKSAIRDRLTLSPRLRIKAFRLFGCGGERFRSPTSQSRWLPGPQN